MTGMNNPMGVLSADDLHSAVTHAACWEQAVLRVAGGETVPVIAHGKHVADVVPSGTLEQLRETIEVLSDTEAIRALGDTETVAVGRQELRALMADRASE